MTWGKVMANGLYSASKKAFLDGQINMLANDLRVILVNTNLYTPDLPTHAFLSSVPAGARVAVSGSLTSKTTTNGEFAADPISYPLVGPAGTPINALLLYQHTGVDATSRLIEWKDSFPGLPTSANGGQISVTWGSYMWRGFGPCGA